MSGRLDADAAARARARPARRARRRRGAARDRRERLGGVADDPLPATLYLDGQLGARRRHAPLLRPRVDGALARGARAVPRPPGRRVLRDDPGRSSRCDGSTTKYVLKQAARGLVPDRIIDKPKIGFFHAAVDGWFRAQTRGAISDYLLGPNPRYAEFLDRGAVERLVTRPRGRQRTRGNGHVLLSDPDARGLALDVPAARARAPTRRRASASRVAMIRSYARRHAGARRGGRTCRGSRRASPRRRRAPRAWMIVDNGSTDGTLDGRRRARAPSTPWIDVLVAAGRDGGRARRADRAGAPRGHRRARAEPAGRRRQGRRRHLVRARTTSSACWRASTPTRRSGSRAAALRARGRRRGGSATSPAAPCGARRAPTAGSASRTCCPLEERIGWDGVDEFKANARGWRTTAVRGPAVPPPPPRGRARRHGVAGARGTRARRVLPGLPALVPRPPCALATLAASRPRSGWSWGYAASAARRAERSSDAPARAYLRRQQSPRNLRRRALEASGRRQPRGGSDERAARPDRRSARLLVGRPPAADARARAGLGRVPARVGDVRQERRAVAARRRARRLRALADEPEPQEPPPQPRARLAHAAQRPPARPAHDRRRRRRPVRVARRGCSGREIVYVESFTRIEGPSLTGRLVASDRPPRLRAVARDGSGAFRRRATRATCSRAHDLRLRRNPRGAVRPHAPRGRTTSSSTRSSSSSTARPPFAPTARSRPSTCRSTRSSATSGRRAPSSCTRASAR